MKRVAIAICIVWSVIIGWYMMTPHTYEDCMLSGMKGVQSNVGAQGVALACRQKFPSPPNPYEQFVNRPNK